MNGRHRSVWLPWPWVLLLLALAPPCPGSRPDPGPPFVPEGDESVLFLDIPSVYSASKYEQKVSEAPSAVTVITAEEIRAHGWRDLAEILQSVRGFYTTYDRNYEYLGMRGFSRPGDYNDRFLLLVDGVRINDSVYGQAFIGREFILDLDLIDRIEVIRGPSSSLYGANAFFGTIQVFTKRGRDLSGVEASGSAGSFGTYQGRISYGDRPRPALEVLASASWLNSDGQDLYFEAFDGPESNHGVAHACDRERTHSAFLKVSTGDVSFQMAQVERTKHIPTAPWDTLFNDTDAWSSDEGTLISLSYSRSLPLSLNLLTRLSYGRFDYDGSYPYEGDEPPRSTRIVMTDYSRAETWTGEFQLSKSFANGHRVIGGFEVRDNTRQDQGYFDAASTLDDRRDSRNWGLFVQDEFRLSRRLLLNAGIRHDDYGDRGSSTHPRIALIASAGAKTTVKLIFGEAFRPPNMYELYYEDGGISQKTNPGLEPETIRTYELLLERSLGRHWYVTAGVFHLTIDHLITQQTDPADDLIYFDNLGTVETKGAEVELETRGWRGLRGRISYAYQEAVYRDTGEILTNSPRSLARMNLLVPFLDDRLTAGLEGRYTSGRTTLHGERAGGFGVVDFTLSGKAWIPRVEFSAGVYNLLDREYGDPGAEEHLQDLIPQDGRSYRLKVVARW